MKRVIRQNDDSLYDVDEDRRTTREELRDFLADGGFFEVRRQSTGGDCTFEVVQQIVAASHRENLASMPTGGPGWPGGGAGGPGMAATLGNLTELLSAMDPRSERGQRREGDAERQSRRRLLRPEWGRWESDAPAPGPRRARGGDSDNWAGEEDE